MQKNKENNDRIIKFLAYDGKVSVKCINSTYLVETARKIHDLSPTVTAAMGRLLSITCMMGADMKNTDDSMTIQVKGNGPIGTMTTVVSNFPKVKGYVVNPLVDIPLREDGKIDVGTAVGKQGMIYIMKDIGLKEPYSGISPIISGEIAEDFTNYFATSEQTPTVVALGVLVDKNGVKSSGGYMINLMPDATEKEIEKIEQNIKNAAPISKMLDDNLSLIEIAKKVTGDNNIKIIEENIIPVYECNCSREKIEKGLISIGEKELKDIRQKDGKAEIVCNFCNTKYDFSKIELEKLIEEGKSSLK